MKMKKKSEGKAKSLKIFAEKSRIKLFIFLILASMFSSIPVFLTGCAKTGYPQPPKTKPVNPPVLLSIKKQYSGLMLIYNYYGNIDSVKGFFIYRKRLVGLNEKARYSCSDAKPKAFQNLLFVKKFTLRNGNFFYKFNKIGLKTGFYLFCLQSVNKYGIKSGYSNYKIVNIILQK